MDKKFIYVFDIYSKDLLLTHGFVPIKFDEKNNIFAFYNQDVSDLKFEKIIHLKTDIITF